MGNSLQTLEDAVYIPCLLISYIELEEKPFLPSGQTIIHANDTLGLLSLPEYIPHFSVCPLSQAATG
jgi:hypothetical protein